MIAIYFDIETKKVLYREENQIYVPNINEKIIIMTCTNTYEGFVEDKVIDKVNKLTVIKIYLRINKK